MQFRQWRRGHNAACDPGHPLRQRQGSLYPAGKPARTSHRAKLCRHDEQHVAGNVAQAPHARRRSPAGWQQARPGRPRIIATPGSSAIPAIWSPASGSAMTTIRRREKLRAAGFQWKSGPLHARGASGHPVASLPNARQGGFLTNLIQWASQGNASRRLVAQAPVPLAPIAASGQRMDAPRAHQIPPRARTAGGLDGWLVDRLFGREREIISTYSGCRSDGDRSVGVEPNLRARRGRLPPDEPPESSRMIYLDEMRDLCAAR